MNKKITMRTFKQFIFSIISFLFKTRMDINYIYNADFFKDNIELIKTSAEDTVDIIVDLFHPKSVLDVGCATGIYLKEFYNRDIEIQGIEGSSKAEKYLLIPSEYFLIHDLRYPLRLNKKYDICICFEVAEHIPTKKSKNLVDILTNHSDIIIFTAAPPGQGGKHHINEQPESYWSKIFKEYSFAKDNYLNGLLKAECIKRNIVSYMYENISVYKKII